MAAARPEWRHAEMRAWDRPRARKTKCWRLRRLSRARGTIRPAWEADMLSDRSAYGRKWHVL
jgi:hypothetical protein